MKTRTYAEMVKLPTYMERYGYLKLGGIVGVETFGFDRYFNQRFYASREWKAVRDFVIVRDGGCDFGMEDYAIQGRILIHHMNPVSCEDIMGMREQVMDPAYLVCVAHGTHNAIHYGDEGLLARDPIVRRRGDTCPWKT